ncbi:MAG: DUF4037 domain-containing protein [Caldilineaceae bacterium]
MNNSFIPGLQLNGRFYHEIVRSLLDRAFPGLPHSAALIGYGSDVLGYDTTLSADHNWGPRLQIFLAPIDHARYGNEIDQWLRRHLPHTFLGYPVNFGEPQPDDNGVQQVNVNQESGEVQHRLEITTLPTYVGRYLGLDPTAELDALDWLTLSEQRLLEITAGEVYHDGLAELMPLRAKFAYYPHDVWLYRMAAQWVRISQEQAFMGRCGDVGDELGSRLVAARLVRDLMRLAFLLERCYAPYSKWLGTAFVRLPCGPTLAPLLNQVLDSHPWQARQEPLCAAYLILAEMHNALGIAERVEPQITDYFNRPYKVFFADALIAATQRQITDPQLRALPPNVGGVDQWVDSTDVTTEPYLMRKLRNFYS